MTSLKIKTFFLKDVQELLEIIECVCARLGRDDYDSNTGKLRPGAHMRPAKRFNVAGRIEVFSHHVFKVFFQVVLMINYMRGPLFK